MEKSSTFTKVLWLTALVNIGLTTTLYFQNRETLYNAGWRDGALKGTETMSQAFKDVIKEGDAREVTVIADNDTVASYVIQMEQAPIQFINADEIPTLQEVLNNSDSHE